MKDTENKVAQILSETEARLLEQISNFAKEGDLDGVDLARSAVGRVRTIIETVATNRIWPTHSKGTRQTNKTRQKPRRDLSKARLEYPIFQVSAEQLEKIGWSKKSSKEYHQKVPRKNYEAVISFLADLAKNGSGPYTGEQVTAKVEELSNPTIPSYQTYVVLGSLKHRGIIEQVGREGYLLPQELENRALAEWESMQTNNKR